MFFNDSITSSKFTASSKLENTKTGQKVLKKIADLSVSYLWFRRFLRELFATK